MFGPIPHIGLLQASNLGGSLDAEGRLNGGLEPLGNWGPSQVLLHPENMFCLKYVQHLYDDFMMANTCEDLAEARAKR